MKKAMLNLVLFAALMVPCFYMNQTCANQSDQKEQWKCRKKKGYQPTKTSCNTSVYDYVTMDNVGAAVLIVGAGFATGGAVLAAVLPWCGVATGPSITTGALAGGAVGTGVAVGAGATALGVKKYREKK